VYIYKKNCQLNFLYWVKVKNTHLRSEPDFLYILRYYIFIQTALSPVLSEVGIAHGFLNPLIADPKKGLKVP
jgi:hypothetical protein